MDTDYWIDRRRTGCRYNTCRFVDFRRDCPGTQRLGNMMLTGYLLKVGYEVLATPLTYLVINWLKRAEDSDAFDRHENFNPFSFSEAAARED